MIRAVPLALLLLVAACARSSDAPGGVSADEAQQLNDAAEMLDANSLSANTMSAE